MQKLFKMIEEDEDVDIQAVLQDRCLPPEKRAEVRAFLIDLMFKRMTVTTYVEYKESFEEEKKRN